MDFVPIVLSLIAELERLNPMTNEELIAEAERVGSAIKRDPNWMEFNAFNRFFQDNWPALLALARKGAEAEKDYADMRRMQGELIKRTHELNDANEKIERLEEDNAGLLWKIREVAKAFNSFAFKNCDPFPHDEFKALNDLAFLSDEQSHPGSALLERLENLEFGLECGEENLRKAQAHNDDLIATYTATIKEQADKIEAVTRERNYVGDEWRKDRTYIEECKKVLGIGELDLLKPAIEALTRERDEALDKADYWKRSEEGALRSMQTWADKFVEARAEVERLKVTVSLAQDYAQFANSTRDWKEAQALIDFLGPFESEDANDHQTP